MILKQFKELQSFLETPKNIVIIGHRNPDGDAMGATLGLYHYLKKKGHLPTVVVPNEYPKFLHWLPGSEATYRFDWQNSQSQRAIKSSSNAYSSGVYIGGESSDCSGSDGGGSE